MSVSPMSIIACLPCGVSVRKWVWEIEHVRKNNSVTFGVCVITGPARSCSVVRPHIELYIIIINICVISVLHGAGSGVI